MSQTPDPKKSEEAPVPQEAKEKQPCILVVDDEPDLCELIESELQSKKFKVITANNGDMALIKFKNIEASSDSRCSMILTDVRMPGKYSGPAWIEELVKQEITVPPFAFISAFSEIDPEDAYNKGACAMFKKPFMLKEIVELARFVHGGDFAERTKPQEGVPANLPIPEKPLDLPKLNFGEMGFFCSPPGIPKVGAWLGFHFLLPETNEPVKGISRVRWIRSQETPKGPAGFGAEIIQFVDNTNLTWKTFQKKIKKLNFIPQR